MTSEVQRHSRWVLDASNPHNMPFRSAVRLRETYILLHTTPVMDSLSYNKHSQETDKT